MNFKEQYNEVMKVRGILYLLLLPSLHLLHDVLMLSDQLGQALDVLVSLGQQVGQTLVFLLVNKLSVTFFIFSLWSQSTDKGINNKCSHQHLGFITCQNSDKKQTGIKTDLVKPDGPKNHPSIYEYSIDLTQEVL